MQNPPNSPQSQEPYQGQPSYQQSQPLGEQWHTQPPPMPQYPQVPQQQPYNQTPPQYAQQQQQMYQPQPVNVNIQMQPQPQYQQPMMVNNVVQVNVNHGGPSFLVRALYFIFIGWWAGFFWLNLGFALCMFIVTLPLGLVMLNRLPQVLTLRSQGTSTNVQMTSVMSAGGVVNVVNVNVGGTKQVNFFIRALYFVFIGCWVGYLWACIGYGICLTVLGLPLGLLMLNRLPAVLTLRKN